MEEAAFASFYESTCGALRNYVARGIRDAALVDDIVQEAFVRLLQADTDRLEAAPIRAYVFRIATNLMNDHWRRSRRDARDESDMNELPAMSSADLDLGVDLERALGKLPPQQRTLLWLAYVEGCNHREISAIMNIGERSVRVLLFRARSRLVDVLRRAGFNRKETP